jgi:hypothetical protein
MKIWIGKFWADKTSDGTRFRAGLLLIISSFPVSAASPVIGTSMSAYTDTWFGFAAGFAVYAFSWVLFLMGVWLAERKGLAMAKELWHVIRHGRDKKQDK